MDYNRKGRLSPSIQEADLFPHGPLLYNEGKVSLPTSNFGYVSVHEAPGADSSLQRSLAPA